MKPYRKYNDYYGWSHAYTLIKVLLALELVTMDTAWEAIERAFNARQECNDADQE